MKIAFKLLVFTVVLICCYQKTTFAVAPIEDKINRVETIEEITDKVSKEYNQNPWLIYNICKAESQFDSNASHDGGAGRGICGIHKATFIGWEKEFGIDLDYNSNYDQLKMTAIAFSKGESYRDDWSTYRRYRDYGVFTVAELRKILDKK